MTTSTILLPYRLNSVGKLKEPTLILKDIETTNAFQIRPTYPHERRFSNKRSTPLNKMNPNSVIIIYPIEFEQFNTPNGEVILAIAAGLHFLTYSNARLITRKVTLHEAYPLLIDYENYGTIWFYESQVVQLRDFETINVEVEAVQDILAITNFYVIEFSPTFGNDSCIYDDRSFNILRRVRIQGYEIELVSYAHVLDDFFTEDRSSPDFNDIVLSIPYDIDSDFDSMYGVETEDATNLYIDTHLHVNENVSINQEHINGDYNTNSQYLNELVVDQECTKNENDDKELQNDCLNVSKEAIGGNTRFCKGGTIFCGKRSSDSESSGDTDDESVKTTDILNNLVLNIAHDFDSDFDSMNCVETEETTNSIMDVDECINMKYSISQEHINSDYDTIIDEGEVSKTFQYLSELVVDHEYTRNENDDEGLQNDCLNVSEETIGGNTRFCKGGTICYGKRDHDSESCGDTDNESVQTTDILNKLVQNIAYGFDSDFDSMNCAETEETTNSIMDADECINMNDSISKEHINSDYDTNTDEGEAFKNSQELSKLVVYQECKRNANDAEEPQNKTTDNLDNTTGNVNKRTLKHCHKLPELKTDSKPSNDNKLDKILVVTKKKFDCIEQMGLNDYTIRFNNTTKLGASRVEIGFKIDSEFVELNENDTVNDSTINLNETEHSQCQVFPINATSLPSLTMIQNDRIIEINGDREEESTINEITECNYDLYEEVVGLESGDYQSKARIFW